ncbi:uncharacterized protein K444DRAFT_637647 [Hyaloscypha bicolor E]|uniref:Uncharacterized protein n=1 Tax=Hyaloscypha bicolor E TaxID=1095630 RepID=A0A2J6SHL7_9HELO|nr:uncharacterized protein K444DRAFT_637647 [Hyaloscypha bicolor E]PMD50254.1 hypothetical protein K444DRAFT_637647 [Hyaloscypha bicolor E]
MNATPTAAAPTIPWLRTLTELRAPALAIGEGAAKPKELDGLVGQEELDELDDSVEVTVLEAARLVEIELPWLETLTAEVVHLLTTPTVQETKDLSSVRSIPQSQLAAQCATVSEDTQPKRYVLTVARTAKETKARMNAF